MNDFIELAKTEPGRVIVTYGRSLIALMIARSLGSRGVEVIGCDDVDLTVLSFSNHVQETCTYRSPREDEDGFIEDLLEIVENHRPNDDRPYVLMPGFDEAGIIARHADRFGGLIRLACPSIEAIDAVHPKDNFARTVALLDLPGPKTFLPETAGKLEEMIADISFPVFVKPPEEVGGRGISKIDDAQALKEAFAELEERYPGQQLLIQELAEGVDYCFCGLFEKGEMITHMVYRNLQKFPSETGPGVARETMDGAPFVEAAAKLMKALDWHGVAEIDFMWDGNPETTPKMIEVNPRFWAGLDHSIRSEVDFPWLLWQMIATGQVLVEEVEAAVGRKTRLPGLSSLALLESTLGAAVDFTKLEETWPDIRRHLKDQELGRAGGIFRDALKETFNLDEALAAFRKTGKRMKEAEEIDYGKDDPFIGLGFLFVLSSLWKHGKLPPEMTR
ncbi:ATP-grasp domain-containing protein [Emcibacter sp.]|uniref:carboxylate--amine ligase n=1 Tax=Emcibacter sp. TaxID=1979954 RepID=UPI003A95B2CB